MKTVLHNNVNCKCFAGYSSIVSVYVCLDILLKLMTEFRQFPISFESVDSLIIRWLWPRLE